MSIKGEIKLALFKTLPLDLYLKIIYKYYIGGNLNLKKPERFSEKLYWLKKYNSTVNADFMQQIYDKYTVRDYIVKKVGEGHLPKLYGVFSRAEDINFSLFPEKYVLKVSQSNGFNIINDGTLNMSQQQIISQMKEWLNCANERNMIQHRMAEESYYFNGRALIICEEYLEDASGNAAMDTDFWCFNGKPLFHEVYHNYIINGKPNPNCFKNIYSLDGQYIPVSISKKTNPDLPRPEYENFQEMISIAEKLAENFVFVRVDLYNVDGRIYVGELTPIPIGGKVVIDPISYDYQWGKLLDLPTI